MMKVRFSDPVVAGVLEVGAEDRKSQWITIAADRMRFQDKIKAVYAPLLETTLQFRIQHAHCDKSNHTSCLRYWLDDDTSDSDLEICFCDESEVESLQDPSPQTTMGGIDASVCLYFYRDGKRKAEEVVYCDNFVSTQAVYDVSKYDKIIVKFRTNYESCTSDEDADADEPRTNTDASSDED